MVSVHLLEGLGFSIIGCSGVAFQVEVRIIGLRFQVLEFGVMALKLRI